MERSTLSRRLFTGGSLASMAVAPALNVLGANDKVQLGFIGLGGRGSHHLRQFLSDERLSTTSSVVSLSDPDQRHVDRASERVGSHAPTSQDFRHVIEDEDVDAVVISTPDHWHAIQTILACQAGKDVYVEKPMTHTIEEAFRVMDVVDRTKRVVAVGQQQRSQGQFREAVEMVQSGGLGTITSVRCINIWSLSDYLSGGAQGIGFPADTEPPAELDYELWVGPAPMHPFNPNRFHVKFYFFLDYAGGMMTGWGVHLFDIVHWAMGNDLRGAYCVGGNYAHDDMRDTPDTAEVVFDTPGYTFSYCLRHGNGFPNDPREGDIDHGIYFYGTKATLLVNRRYAKLYPEDNMDNVTTIPNSGGDIDHKLDFLSCIHSRKDPVCTVQDGFRANLPGQLGLISYQTGRHVTWDDDKRTVPGDREARALLGKSYRNPWRLPEA